MFDIGLGEMALIMAIALVAIGPKQLPEVARTVAKFIAEVRKMFAGVSDSLAETAQSTQKAVSDLGEEITRVQPAQGAHPVAPQSARHVTDTEVAAETARSSETALPHDPSQKR